MNLNLAAPGGGTVEISEAAFGREFNESLVHQVVVAYLRAPSGHAQAADAR
jgi:large subunit ribosomal protein L4